MRKKYIISVISDSHGEICKYIIPYLKKSDYIFHAGDICSTKIIMDLHKYCDNVFLVAGNNDIPEKYTDKNDKKIINNLKKSQTIKILGEDVSIEHGDRFGHHADHDRLRKLYPDSKLIIYGHTHNQALDKEKNPWVINPGACGYTRNNDGGPCFIQIEINENNWNIIPYCFS